MTSRNTLMYLGYDLGTYSDWDGDEDSQRWYNWRPGSDIALPVPNMRGNELMLVIFAASGMVEIRDREDDEDEWNILLTTTWRALIGHTRSAENAA